MTALIMAVECKRAGRVCGRRWLRQRATVQNARTQQEQIVNVSDIQDFSKKYRTRPYVT